MSTLQRLLEHLEEEITFDKERRSEADASRDREDWAYYEGRINRAEYLIDWIAANLSDGWQDIETFRGEDYQSVLVYCAEGRNAYVAYPEKGKWRDYGGNCGFLGEIVTHWQPLPEPPAGKGEA